MLEGDISMGAGVTLRSLPKLEKQLGIPGLDADGIKILCELLHVPCIRISDTWFVNMFELQIGVAGVTQMGMPDFAFPGSDQELCPTDAEQILKKLPILTTKLVMYRRSTLKEAHDSVIEGARNLAGRLKAALATQIKADQRKEPYRNQANRAFKEYDKTLKEIDSRINEGNP